MLIAGKMKNQYVQNEPAAYETQKTAMSSLRCLKKKQCPPRIMYPGKLFSRTLAK